MDEFTLLNARGKKEVLEWCMKEKLIASSYECPKCKEPMKLCERKSVALDGYEWRCRKKGVNAHDVCRSARKNLWFSHCKLSIYDILRLTKCWFGRCMNEFVVNEIKVNKTTVVDWYVFCREVCLNEIMNNSVKIGDVKCYCGN